MFPQPLFNLLLVRHGQTQANAEGRFYGRTDSPMTDAGREQVRATAERLKDRPVSHVYASPAMRASETAEILNRQWNKPLTIDERLWEIDHARWELLTPAEIQAQYPADWERFLTGDISRAHHGGETHQQVAARTISFLNDIKQAHPCEGETIVMAAHGGLLGIMICELLGTTMRGRWPYRFKNAGVAEVLVYEYGGVMTSFQ